MGSGVVVLARPGLATNILVNALQESTGVDHVVLEQPGSRRTFLAQRVRKLGLATVVGQLAFMAMVAPVLRVLARRRVARILAEHDLDASPPAGASVTTVRSVNDRATVDMLRTMAPHVVVLSGTRIVAAHVLNHLSATFLNLHAGITPAYRGVHGGYWALAEKRPEACGATVHQVDAGIDTGAVVAQALIEPNDADSFATYPLLQLAAGLPLLTLAVRMARDGHALPALDGPGPSRAWSHPTLWGYLRRRIMSGVR